MNDQSITHPSGFSDADLTETELDGEIVYEGSFFRVQKDRVRLPDGGVATREYIRHPGAVVILPLFDDGTVLVERQFRYPVKRIFIEFPAGKIDRGEDRLASAKRELEEETGYRSENLEWLITLRTTVAFCNERIEVFVARDLIPSRQHLDEDEFIDLKAYTLEELKEKIFSGEIEDSKTIAALLAYETKYRKTE